MGFKKFYDVVLGFIDTLLEGERTSFEISPGKERVDFMIQVNDDMNYT